MKREKNKKLYLTFDSRLELCTGYTHDKRIAKTYCKERGKDTYYVRVPDDEINKAMRYIDESGESFAEELEPYTSDPSRDIRNIMTTSDYEMFADSFYSYYLGNLDAAVNELDKLLVYLKFTKEEKYYIFYLFQIIYALNDDETVMTDHPCELNIDEETAIKLYIKNNLKS